MYKLNSIISMIIWQRIYSRYLHTSRKPFSFEFVDEGRSCKLQANVNIPGHISKVDEFAKRIVNYHGMPVYLEEGIIHLKRFFIVGCNV